LLMGLPFHQASRVAVILGGLLTRREGEIILHP